MKRLIAALGLLLALSSPAFADPEIAKPAPSFTVTDAISGQKISLSQFKGHPVVLEWNNFECPFVKKFYSVGAMQKLQEQAAADGVIWISVNSSAPGKEGYLADAAALKPHLAEQKSHAAYYVLDHDGALGHLYGAKTTPHLFVIDKNGVLAYAGAIDDKQSADSADIATAHNYVSAALASLAAGEPIKVSSTRSYGCSVKY